MKQSIIGIGGIILAVIFVACGEPDVVLEKQSWIDLPRSEWPHLVMTNHIRFKGYEYHEQANGFLIQVAGEVLAVSAKHWFLVFQWHVRLSTVSFRDRLELWEMYPKNMPGEKVVLGALLNENPDEKVVKEEIFNTDWLVFRVTQKSDSIMPLIPRFSELKDNERIFIPGWKDSESGIPARVYEGKCLRSDGNKYVVDMGGDFPGLSGAPVIDEKGYLVGISSASFKKYSWVNSTAYLREILKSNGIIPKE